MKKKWKLLIFVGIISAALAVYYFVTRETEKDPSVVQVEKGVFEMTVSSMGELEALVSEQITIPDIMMNLDWRLRIYELPISDIVKEGTIVKKGDYVASLNPMQVEEQLKTRAEEMVTREAELENAKIDSSLVLTEARDGIRKAKDNVLDKEIRVEQSIYESQAVQRQAQISLEVSQRNFEQAERNYIRLKRRHEMQVERAQERLDRLLKDISTLEEVKRTIIIHAPGDGLVVYERDYSGEKIKVGSYVSRWNPFIAMLPDLSTIQSVTYVKEIDISKIKAGLAVRLKIDAFPEKEFIGKITRVANVGQEIAGQFLTGFKVDIKVEPAGETLLPGMTSTNNIVVQSYSDVLTLPRPAIFSASNRFFVYKREGLSTVKQQVAIGGENETHVLIAGGLEKGDRILMHPPKNADELQLAELIDEGA
ncbi:MAG: efflux RND transporter periplasmic adaptor subunit [Cytophagaceae bacterium]|jgi:multidrug efflux pump subunit AcrA (membrane-fusion protein)|nr:efflux RND transporter periplasmic adaptor subunit [Cytophagaceae bacterium]